MARDIQDFPNVEGPSTQYPLGSIKNDDGTNNGTPVNRTVYSDLHQFFNNMMVDASVVANGLPDDAINGFQLIEALRKFPTETSARVNALHGLFDEPLADIGSGNIGSSSGEALTVYEGEVYVGDDVSIKVFNVITGALVRTLTITDFNEFKFLQVYNGVLYTVSRRISSPGAFFNIIDLTTGAVSLSVIIAGVFDYGEGMFVRANRIYLTDIFFKKVFVYNATTGASVPGEDFGSNANMTDPRGIFLVDDLAYLADAAEGKIKKYNINNLSFQGEIASNFSPSFISIVGDKIYLTNNFGVVFTYSIKTGAGIGEDFPGSDGAIFIKDNKCYIYDNINNKIEVTQQNTVTEYI